MSDDQPASIRRRGRKLRSLTARVAVTAAIASGAAPAAIAQASGGPPAGTAYGQATTGQTTSSQSRSAQSAQAQGSNRQAVATSSGSQVGAEFVHELPLLAIIAVIGAVVIARSRGPQAARGANGLARLGQHKAKRQDTTQKVRFDDVQGIDPVKSELQEIVDFLRNPGKYQRLGAKVPEGVLLYGPPGTGKTLLARAVAGEAGVPFFSASASEFVEMIVGVGAARVRDLFAKARENPVSIIFIDELDAVGKHRGNGLNGGGDEREQTLNQILTEMDGDQAQAHTNRVIVMGATNTPESIDKALLRPGRFDRKIEVTPPDVRGREGILKVHTRNKPLGNTVDLAIVARDTYGMTGADLANVANEAALAAARRGGDVIEPHDFSEAINRHYVGIPGGREVAEQQRVVTAYHEAAHALVAYVTKDFDPTFITSVPRGGAGGFMMNLPAVDPGAYTKDQLLSKAMTALAGYVAEEMITGQTSTGPSSDLRQVNQIMKGMAREYGMMKGLFGLSAVAVPEVLDNGMPNPSNQQELDSAINLTVDVLQTEVEQILRTNREALDTFAKHLMEVETMQGDAILALLEQNGVKRMESVLHIVNGNAGSSQVAYGSSGGGYAATAVTTRSQVKQARTLI